MQFVIFPRRASWRYLLLFDRLLFLYMLPEIAYLGMGEWIGGEKTLVFRCLQDVNITNDQRKGDNKCQIE